MTRLPVVWFERRSALCLGAVRRESPKKLTLVDEQGDTTRIQRARVVGTLAATVADKSAGAELSRLREGWGEPARSAEELYEALGEDALDLSALAERIASPGDAGLAAIVAGLTSDRGELRPGFFVRDGRVERRPPDQRDAIRRRREEAEREAEVQREVGAWWRQRGQAPPPVLTETLALLRDYALAAERHPDARAAARLVKQLGLASPDELLEQLVLRGQLAPHVNEVPARQGLPVSFDEATLADAARVALTPLAEGLDLRAVKTIAIDAPGADEIDDALSVFEREGQRLLAIHIARPSVAVLPDDLLDVAARERASSVYFPEETIPMLPSPVTERYGLHAGQEREALSLLVPLERGGALGEPRFELTRIQVDRELDFQGASEDPFGGELIEALLPACERLERARTARGAFMHRTANVKVVFDEAGEPLPRLLGVDGPAQLVVSELMVFYNEHLALALRDAGLPAFYRVQASELEPHPSPRDDFGVLQARRQLPPTRIQVDPGPQRTMGLEAYVQGTSPLRRYADLVAQRQLTAHLRGEAPPYDEDAMRDLIEVLPKVERRARQAEEERLRYHLARWLIAQGRFKARVSRRGPRAAVYLEAWLRELPARFKGDDTRGVGSYVEVEVRSRSPRDVLRLQVLAK